MSYVSCDMQRFIHDTKGKKVLCFGAGSYFKVMCCDMSEQYPDMQLIGVLDNNAGKSGKKISAASFSTEVLNPLEAISGFDFSNLAILITTAQLNAVKEQLEGETSLAGVKVYSYYDIKRNSASPLIELKKTTPKPLIPKKIHYCWFGSNEPPRKLQRCIDTWKTFCPDYEVKRWDESNYDIGKTAFTKSAYETKKWGFVPDYARLDIVYNEGGMYFDTDVELRRSPEVLRYNEGFIGTEITGCVNAGSGLGAVEKNQALRELMDMYEEMSGYQPETAMGRDTVYFYNKGYIVSDHLQVVDDITILPYNILAHKAYETGESFEDSASVSVHLFDGSWR